MTQAGYRHRVIIQDRSGSMSKILSGAQSGLSEFFDSEEKVPGKATYSLWDFSDSASRQHSFAPIADVRSYVIVPGGMTAMFDAIGDAVTAEGARLAEMPEDQRPEDVTVIIASDGLNNASHRYTGPQVNDMLQHQREVYGWRVIYMGTNQDALKAGEEIGVSRGTALNYSKSQVGVRNTWSSAASLLNRAPVAAAATGGYEFTARERAKAAEVGDLPGEPPR